MIDNQVTREKLRGKFDRPDLPYFEEAWVLYNTKIFPGFDPAKKDVLTALVTLKDIINSLKRAAAEAGAGVVHLPSADNRLRSEETRARLLPTVERIRIELFGKALAPFRTVERASEWLEREIRRDEAQFRKAGLEKAQARVIAIDGQIKKLLGERRRIWPVAITVTEDQNTLDIWKPLKGRKRRGAFYPFRTYPGTCARRLRDEVKGIETLARGAEPVALAFEGTDLQKLRDEIRDLEALSRFTERQILFWILADVKPLGITANLRLYGPVTAREFQAMYKEVSRIGAAFRSKARPRKLTAKNEEVVRFVRGLGGPPGKGIMEFWGKAKTAWNQSHQGPGFTSRTGLKNAYKRAMDKIEGSRKDNDWHVRGVAAFPGIDQRAIGKALADGKKSGQEIIIVYFPEAPKNLENNYATFIADRLFLDAAIDRFVRSGGKPFED